MDQIEKYLSPVDFTDKQIDAQQKYTIKDNDQDNQDDQFRCKSLATIYNFFEIGKDSKNEKKFVRVKKGKLSELAEYITNSNEYSTEHFIINNKKGFKIKIGDKVIPVKYPGEIGAKSSSLFNFIFIPKNHNSEMNNMLLTDKFDYMDKNVTIKCEYSKMVYNIFSSKMRGYPQISPTDTEETAKEKCKNYYENDFKNQYVECVKEIIESIQKKFYNMF